jgi:hypothetical protein
MKRLLLAGSAIGALIAPAMAADMPVKVIFEYTDKWGKVIRAANIRPE